MIRIVALIAAAYLLLVLAYALYQRRLLYYPTHHHSNNALSEWRHCGRLIGLAREVASPATVWLMLHGNGGQASDRAHALSSFSQRDSVFILEYPGYGDRPGSPSMEAFNSAAREGYQVLRSRFPDRPVCVVGESLGSGPASALALLKHPPDKIVLITPFDKLSRVAAHHFPFIPAALVLRDNWNNVEALRGYRGALEIYGARDDLVIPIRYARALADSNPSARFLEIEGGHNGWGGKGIRIRKP